jgi:hypothetical protein
MFESAKTRPQANNQPRTLWGGCIHGSGLRLRQDFEHTHKMHRFPKKSQKPFKDKRAYRADAIGTFSRAADRNCNLAIGRISPKPS